MKLPRIVPLLFSAALGLSAVRAAQTITLDAGPAYGGDNPWQAGNGGEFTALAPSLGVPAGYSSEATWTSGGTEGFETFCVQEGTYFTPGASYDFVSSPYVWVPTYNASVKVDQDLSVGTAWLYRQFATGLLSGFDYANADSRKTDAWLLQNAIWSLQGDSALPAPGTNPFADLAASQFGSIGAALAAESPNEFGVSVLDLYRSDGGAITVAQPQLVLGNAPDRFSTGLFLAGGTFCLMLARRLPSRARQA